MNRLTFILLAVISGAAGSDMAARASASQAVTRVLGMKQKDMPKCDLKAEPIVGYCIMKVCAICQRATGSTNKLKQKNSPVVCPRVGSLATETAGSTTLGVVSDQACKLDYDDRKPCEKIKVPSCDSLKLVIKGAAVSNTLIPPVTPQEVQPSSRIQEHQSVPVEPSTPLHADNPVNHPVTTDQPHESQVASPQASLQTSNEAAVPAPSTEPQPGFGTSDIAIVVVCVLVLGIGAYMFMQASSEGGDSMSLA